MEDIVLYHEKSGVLKRLRRLFWRVISPLPDRPYVALKYATILGRLPDLGNPASFTEKLQARKLNDHDPLYPTLVDKADAKNYIAERVGEEHVIPTYWVGADLDEIEWNKIPFPAVVKPTHASAHGFFLRSPEDVTELMKMRPEADWLSRRHDRVNREWAYQQVTPRIVIEKMLENDGKPLTEYCFFAFNGHLDHIELRYPKDGTMFEARYSTDWERLNVTTNDLPRSPEEVPRPARLEEMKDIARKLSTGIPFLRVDLYASDDWVLVGEMTLYPGGGYEVYEPQEYDLHLGREWERWNS